ncbi:hypothetical protein LINPERPRIM_LOCUS41213 [Linum perenne]
MVSNRVGSDRAHGKLWGEDYEFFPRLARYILVSRKCAFVGCGSEGRIDFLVSFLFRLSDCFLGCPILLPYVQLMDGAGIGVFVMLVWL